MNPINYTGPGTRLQSQQNRSESRVAGVMERFGRLKTEINEWEMLVNSQVIFPDVINRQFNSLSRVIQDLAREALLARVKFSMCGKISNYKTIINQIRQNAMKGIDPQNDLAPSPPNHNLDSVFCNKLNLSTIDPPNNRMQRPSENIEIENQNLYGSQLFLYLLIGSKTVCVN